MRSYGRPGGTQMNVTPTLGEQAGWSDEERAAYDRNQREATAQSQRHTNDPTVGIAKAYGLNPGQTAQLYGTRSPTAAEQGAAIAKYGSAGLGSGIVANRYVDPWNVNRDAYAYRGRDQAGWDATSAAAMHGAPTADLAQSDASRAMMQNAANQYAALASGHGPSLAQAQLQSGVDRSIAAQIAAANSQRGGPMAQAGALRQAQLAGQDMRTQAVNQAAQLRAQEQLGALAGYGNVAGQMRTGDLAGSQMNIGAALANQGQNDALRTAGWQQGSQASLADVAGRAAGEQAAQGAFERAQDTNARMTYADKYGDREAMRQALGTAGNVGGATAGWFWNMFGRGR